MRDASFPSDPQLSFQTACEQVIGFELEINNPQSDLERCLFTTSSCSSLWHKTFQKLETPIPREVLTNTIDFCERPTSLKFPL